MLTLQETGEKASFSMLFLSVHGKFRLTCHRCHIRFKYNPHVQHNQLVESLCLMQVATRPGGKNTDFTVTKHYTIFAYFNITKKNN